MLFSKLGRFRREQAIELRVDHVGHFLEVLRIVAELDVVRVDDQQVAVVILDPVLIFFIEAGQVIDADHIKFGNNPEDFAKVTDMIDAQLYGLFTPKDKVYGE